MVSFLLSFGQVDCSITKYSEEPMKSLLSFLPSLIFISINAMSLVEKRKEPVLQSNCVSKPKNNGVTPVAGRARCCCPMTGTLALELSPLFLQPSPSMVSSSLLLADCLDAEFSSCVRILRTWRPRPSPSLHGGRAVWGGLALAVVAFWMKTKIFSICHQPFSILD